MSWEPDGSGSREGQSGGSIGGGSPVVPTGSTDIGQTLYNLSKALVLLLFASAGAVFLYVHWTELGDLLHNVNKFEAYGIKVELVNQLADSVFVQRIKGEGTHNVAPVTSFPWSPENRERLIARMTWSVPALDGARILWVDDQPENNNNEMQLLSASGVIIHLARNNAEAMAALSANTDKPFDLIISDVSRDNEPRTNILDLCPVHWWSKEVNDEEYNKQAEAGFYLAELLERERTKTQPQNPSTVPVIIYFTGYGGRVVSRCSPLVTNYNLELIHFTIGHLARVRAAKFRSFSPPLSTDKHDQPIDEKPKPEEEGHRRRSTSGH